MDGMLDGLFDSLERREESMEELNKAFAKLGVSIEEAANAFRNFARYIPPFTEEDIARVKRNPSLSFIDKFRIIRNIRKQMKG